MIQDIRYAIRMLIKNRGFSLVVVLTLALGIGANAALFSVVNGVLLNPLPFSEPDQLVTILQSKPNFDMGAVPYPNFLDLQSQNQTFESMAIFRSTGFSLIGSGEPERVRGRFVSGDFFKVLKLKPELGRVFTADDDKPGSTPVAIIGADLWARKFASSPEILHQSITLDDKSYAVVGVTPHSFNLFSGDVFVPINQWGTRALKNRGAALGLRGVGRLKPGVTIEQADADLDRIMANLAITYPDTNKDNSAKLVGLKSLLLDGIGSTLWILLGAVGFVLLIACVNVSNLMLARSTGRTREFAIRAALGAARSRLLRQSLVESVLLSLIGGVLGLVIATWGTKFALAALPTTLPRASEIALDTRVVLFTAVVSLITGILTGLVPALKTSQWRFNETLKETGRGANTGRVRTQGVFVAVEMALALVLLVGAGLMVRTLSALWKVNPGFRSDNVTTFGLSLPPAARNSSADESRTTLRQISDRVSAIPGVKSASFTVGATPLQNEDDLFFWIEGEPKPAGHQDMHMALFYTVEPGYLDAMGITLKRGRFFNNQDDDRAKPVAVIDEALAGKYFGETDPIGKRINLEGNDVPSEIVGVVGHVKQFGLDADHQQTLQAQLYLPFRALPDSEVEGFGGAGVVLRSQGGNAQVFNAVRQVIREQNSQNIISNVQTLDEVVASSLGTQRFSLSLLTAFASVALLLAALGIYGVISYLVGQRGRELGIRIALGASRGNIFRLVLVHGMKMTLVGVVVGVVAALGLTHLLTKMLFGVSATDPLTFVSIVGILTLTALLACYLPARRATKIDPLIALKNE
ncbi:MAG TPA: ABC transporter permease [Pyrinomonadaceae bacterium]